MRARAAKQVPHSGLEQAGIPAKKPLHRARICFSCTDITSRKEKRKRVNEDGCWLGFPPARLDSWIHPSGQAENTIYCLARIRNVNYTFKKAEKQRGSGSKSLTKRYSSVQIIDLRILYPGQVMKEIQQISGTHIYQSACQKRVVALELVKGALLVVKRCFGPPLLRRSCCLFSAAACTHRTRCSPSPPPSWAHALLRGRRAFSVTLEAH